MTAEGSRYAALWLPAMWGNESELANTIRTADAKKSWRHNAINDFWIESTDQKWSWSAIKSDCTNYWTEWGQRDVVALGTRMTQAYRLCVANVKNTEKTGYLSHGLHIIIQGVILIATCVINLVRLILGGALALLNTGVRSIQYALIAAVLVAVITVAWPGALVGLGITGAAAATAIVVIQGVAVTALIIAISVAVTYGISWIIHAKRELKKLRELTDNQKSPKQGRILTDAQINMIVAQTTSPAQEETTTASGCGPPPAAATASKAATAGGDGDTSGDESAAESLVDDL